MKTDDLLDALGEADPAYIQEAEDVRYLGARRKHFMQMAACVALLLIGGSYGMWQQYENATHTDVAKTESAETADTYEAAASDGDMTSDAAAPYGTAESAEEYEAAAQSTAGDGNGIQEAAQPESAAGTSDIDCLRGGSGEDGFTHRGTASELLRNQGDSGCNSGWLCADG